MESSEGARNYHKMEQDLNWLKQDCMLIRNAVLLLQDERDSLRQAVRKLKLENAHTKDKVRNLQAEVKRLGGSVGNEDDDINKDYDELGREFLLVGGKNDPLGLRYEVPIRDNDGGAHRSSERYYWYKMAQFFEDHDAMTKIQQASAMQTAEEAATAIKSFDKAKWSQVKAKYWEEAQQLKLEQHRWIKNLLALSLEKKIYIAVADQDKVIGTGWRKNREESNKPVFWDGENQGGRFLMRYRKSACVEYPWSSDFEKKETEEKYNQLRKEVWRRVDANYRGGPGVRGGHGARGGRGGGGRPYLGQKQGLIYGDVAATDAFGKPLTAPFSSLYR